MTETPNQQNIYPQDVTFGEYTLREKIWPGHYSIFMVSLSHNARWERIKKGNSINSFVDALIGTGWHAHESCHNGESASSTDERPFAPKSIFTPPIAESFLGETEMCFPHGGNAHDSRTALHDFVLNRLDPRAGRPFSEPLIFSLKSEWLNKPVSLHFNDGKAPEQSEVIFEWADLWLHNDGTGMLAFKVSLIDDGGIDISRISRLVRTMRDFKSPSGVSVSMNGGKPIHLWHEIVFPEWLAFQNSTGNSKILLTSGRKAMDIIDRFQRYSKVLTACQITEGISADKEPHWGRPIMDPPMDYNDEDIESMASGEWSMKAMGAQMAIAEGYATVRDLVLFELATCSEEGSAVGENCGRAWQYSPEYIRQMCEEKLIEIWEYWAAMCLRDTCVFVSFDPSMPIMWQAEARYYPLYAYVYQLRFRMDVMSEQIVDHDMSDVVKGREVRDKFQRFRNQYWFKEITTDFMGEEIFDRMKAGMELNALYETVKEEVADVSEHVQEKWDRGTRVLFAALLLLLAPIQSLWEDLITTFFTNGDFASRTLFVIGSITVFLLLISIWTAASRRIYRIISHFSKLLGRSRH